MKKILTSIAVIAFVSFHNAKIANACDRIGNGGGLWTCTDPKNQISVGFLVDLFASGSGFFCVNPVCTETLTK